MLKIIDHEVDFCVVGGGLASLRAARSEAHAVNTDQLRGDLRKHGAYLP